jgi:prolipoprotein diacylglyceryltransferase
LGGLAIENLNLKIGECSPQSKLKARKRLKIWIYRDMELKDIPVNSTVKRTGNQICGDLSYGQNEPVSKAILIFSRCQMPYQWRFVFLFVNPLQLIGKIKKIVVVGLL